MAITSAATTSGASGRGRDGDPGRQPDTSLSALRQPLGAAQPIDQASDRALRALPRRGAWTVLAALAHNLLRWTQLLGLPDTTVRAARMLHRRLLQTLAA